MKKFAYTLVSSPQRYGANDPAPRAERTLTLRETLVIDDGPSYYREYTVATDAFGFTTRGEAPQPG